MTTTASNDQPRTGQDAIDDAEWHDRRNWRLGVFYCSPRDSRAFVPKRHPVMGVTVNFAKRTGVFFPVGILAFTALMFLISSCRAPVHTAPGWNDESVVASARADIEAANSAWLPGLRNRDAASIVAAYADSGLFINRDGSITRGREAIREMYASRFPQMPTILDGGVEQDGMKAVSETRIYEWGRAWLKVQRTGAATPVRSEGSYLTVWERGSDAHWHITRNIAF